MKRTILDSLHRLSIKDRWAVIGLLVLTIVTHFRWFFNFAIFTSGDWQFIGQEQYRSFVTFSPVWVTNGFGGTSATPSFYLIRFFEGILTLIGSNFALNEKLFFFLPIAIVGVFGTYIFLRQYFKEWPSLIGACIFTFNSAMLFNYAGALTIAAVDALTPLALYLYQRYLAKPSSNVLLIFTGLIFAVMASYELRITILVIAIAGALLVSNILGSQDKKAYALQRLWPHAKLGSLILALQAFWLLPYAIGSHGGVTFADNLSAVLFVSFSNIENALALHHPFWTGMRPATFVEQPIPLASWLIPIIAFGGLALHKQPKHIHKETMVWVAVGLAGIFLVKQVNVPLSVAYPWLFNHVPGFAAFRESSKFYLFVALSYAVLVPLTLSGIREVLKKHVKKELFHLRISSVLWITISAGILGLFLINTKPLITGELRTTYVPRQMPQDYAILNRFVDSQRDYFRLLWVPVRSRWGAQSNVHPSVEAAGLGQGAWLKQLNTANLGPGSTLRDKAVNVFNQPTSETMLQRGSIKYVIVPIRDTANEDDFFKNFGDDRQYFIDQLDHASYLKRLNIGTSQLAIYQVSSYEAHIEAFTTLHSLNLTAEAQLDSLFAFITKQLHNEFNFIDHAKSKTAYPQFYVDNIFQDLTNGNVQENTITQRLSPEKNPLLYMDVNSRGVYYVIKNGTIAFYAQPQNNLAINGQHIGPANGPTSLLATRRLNTQLHYYLATSKGFAPISIENGQKNLGTLSGEITLYAMEGDSAVLDGSFEQGLWQREIQDCNDYDHNADIAMELDDNNKTNGQHSLQFISTQHTACTTSNAVRANSRQYLLSFDYFLTDGQSVGYKVTFNDAAKSVISDRVNGGPRWKTYRRIITVPEGADSFRVQLLGYPDYKRQNTTVTDYDNIQMLPLNTALTFTMPAPQYTMVALPSSKELVFSFPNNNPQQGKNIFSNGSFEQGLWRNKVADCDNYDNNPKISMHLTKRGTEKVLELAAQRHSACTSTSVSLEPKNYLLSFDYQGSETQQASYIVAYNDGRGTTIQGTLPLHDHNWHTFTKQLQPPLGTTNMLVTVVAVGDGAGIKTAVNRYASFSLKEVPTTPGQYYLVDAPKQALQKPRQLHITQQGSTKSLIRVKGATTPFYIAMSESYNALWRLELDDSHARGLLGSLLPTNPPNSIKQHFDLNDFENGWYVDPTELCENKSKISCTRESDGSYDFNLVAEFTPQRWFYVGAAISLATVGGILGYLIRSYYAQRKHVRTIYRGRI